MKFSRTLLRGLRGGLLATGAFIGAAHATDDVTYSYDLAGNRSAVVYGATNSAPSAVNDSVSVAAGVAKTIDPRLNDSDADSDPLTVSITGTMAPSHGSFGLNAGQTITYTPAGGYPSGASGSDSFTYKIDDGHSHTATATVNVTVVNTAPVAADDYVTTNYNTTKDFDPRTNDHDDNADTLTVSGVGSPTAPAHGTASIVSGQVRYIPTSGYSGGDAFNYTIGDGHTNSATATVHMTVNPQNQAPVAVDDARTYAHTNSPGNTVIPTVTFDPRAGAGPDSDPDGDTLSVVAVGPASSGHATTSYTSTSVTYLYNNAVSALHTTDSFTYTISDGHSHTATATVTITIEVETGS